MPWARVVPGAAPALVVAMVELEAPPTAVVYAAAMGGRHDPDAKAAATAAARDQLALIEQQQLDLVADLESGTIGASVLHRFQRVYNGIAIQVDRDAIEAIAALPGVRAVHPVGPVRLANKTSVPFLGAPHAWTNPPGVTGAGISIGIIDSGLDYIHLDFLGSGSGDDHDANDPTTIDDGFFPNNKVVGGWDFADDDPDPMEVPGAYGYAHGTHVAGTAAGVGVNADWTPYLGPYDDSTPFDEFNLGPGMAPEADLYALRVFGGASKDLADPFAYITVAVEWAVDPNGDGDFEDHLHVINMSLGDLYGYSGEWLSDACDNAALIGVVSVAAAGNSADGFNIVSRPGAATRAISVAAIHDRESRTIGPVRVNDPPGLARDLYAVWQPFATNPTPAGITADVVRPQPADACSELTNGAEVAGRIVLVDWLGCGLDKKAALAEAAGAVGVIVEPTGWSHLPISYPGGDRVGIPVAMISGPDAAALRALLPGVNATLKIELVYYDLADVVVDFSSRGPRSPDSLLKPDVAAPGIVWSAMAHALAGFNQAAAGVGTSMSTPHVAGAMALLRQLHPDWTVEELKALLMNTAVDVYGGPFPGPKESLSRVGAGRIDVGPAVSADVIAMAAEPEGLVSVSFGFVEVQDTIDLTKTVEVVNHGSESVSFDIEIDLRADLPGASVLPSVTQITVPAGETATLSVALSATASELRDVCDPGASRYVPIKTPFGPELPTGPVAAARSCPNVEAGYLQLVPQSPHGDYPTLRLPVHAVLRPVAAMAASEQTLVITDDTTTHELHLTGTQLNSGTAPPGLRSLASAFELAEVSPENTTIPDEYRAWDIEHIGVTSDFAARAATGQGIEDTVVSFVITTREPHSHPALMYDLVWIDTDRDGEFDVVLEKYPMLHWDANIADSWVYFSDVYWTDSFDLDTGEVRWQFPVNSVPDSEIKADLLNTDTYILSVRADDLGLTEGNSRFDYMITTGIPGVEWSMDESELHTFDAARPGLHLTGTRTAPMFWDDLDGGVIPVKGDRRAYVANGSQGLLLIHHHNATGSRAQVIDIVPAIGEAPRDAGGRAVP